MTIDELARRVEAQLPRGWGVEVNMGVDEDDRFVVLVDPDAVVIESWSGDLEHGVLEAIERAIADDPVYRDAHPGGLP